MSIVTLRASAPTGYTVVPTANPEADFERRWTAWKVRGLAHDRVLRRRFVGVAVLTGASALAAAILYGLLSA